jgi:1-acyl-sn-glycerol-3-phosphate acyltransferase
MSLAHTVTGILDTARISVPTVLDAISGPVDSDVTERRLAWWSSKLLRDARITLAIVGCDHAGDGNEPLVVMSNHQSLYDIPVLFQCGLGKMRMVTKAELFDIPIWGPAMKAAGFIRIDRSDREQAKSALEAEGSALLAAGTRVWIAPEGTRSRTGKLGPFKSGGFRMALERGVRILPVAIEGTRDVLPAKGVTVHVGKRVRVTILPPVDPARYGLERRKELAADVRRAIATALGQTLED